MNKNKVNFNNSIQIDKGRLILFRHQEELEEKIKIENEHLQKDKGYSLKPVLFRDYLAKLELLNDLGEVHSRFNLYYSPKRKAFTITFEKKTSEPVQQMLNKLFEGTRLFQENKSLSELVYQAYVDGSYINSQTGYGAIILKHGIPIVKMSGRIEESDGLHQVTGELRAVQEVLQYCKENGIEEIAIFYDYTGIREWAEKTWKANNPVTQAYQSFITKNTVQIQWHKVKAHSGSMFNEMADLLAKKGALENS